MYNSQTYLSQEQISNIQDMMYKITWRIFGWMFLGVALTAVSAFAANYYNLSRYLTRGTVIGLVLVQLAIVFIFSSQVRHARAGIATAMFLVYSIITGITFSTLIIFYSGASIVSGFALSALIFAVMAAFGFLTKRDLSSLGSVGYVLLFGALLIGVANIFLHLPMINLLINYAILAVFIGLTAYDLQKVRRSVTELVARRSSAYRESDVAALDASIRSLSIMYALSLYLDFVNIFIRILSITGDRRSSN